MKWQWIGLVVFSLTLLPLAVAMIVDRVPRLLRGGRASVRLRGWGFLLIYATAPVNAVPRLAGASPTPPSPAPPPVAALRWPVAWCWGSPPSEARAAPRTPDQLGRRSPSTRRVTSRRAS